MTSFLILGDDSARAAALAQHLPQAGDQVWMASRLRPSLALPPSVNFHWMQVDLSERGVGARIARTFGSQPLDVCIYDSLLARSEASAMPRSPEQITALHFTSAILCLQLLMPNLRRARCARIVFIGPPDPPLSDPHHTQLGIRSVAQALREVIQHDPIGVTCLYTADDLLIDGNPQCEARRSDLIAVVRCVITLSPHSNVQEIDFLSR